MPDPTPQARAIALGLVRTARAAGRARRDDDLDTLQLPCAGMDAAFYFIGFSGRALMRGNSFKEAEPLQQGFRRAMAAAGRGGTRVTRKRDL